MKRRFTLSLFALVGSVFVFVFATFAWWQVAGNAGVEDIPGEVNNIDAAVVLYASEDGLTYEQSNTIVIGSGSPGNTYFFQVVVENTGAVAVYNQVVLRGFVSGVSDTGGTYEGYNAGLSLVNVIRVTTSNSNNSDTIDNVIMSDLMPIPQNNDYSYSSLYLVQGIYLAPSTSYTLNVTFYLDETTGNEYQNLSLTIDQVSVESEAAE